MPCIALTAQSGLETLKAARGQTVLVFGASGGVGSCAVWLGSEKGATVVGTARPTRKSMFGRWEQRTQSIQNPRNARGAIKRAAKGRFRRCPGYGQQRRVGLLLSHLKPKAPIAFPNGVEPKPRFAGHPVSAFDGAMSHEAFEKLNAAIGTRTLPLRVHVFSFKDVAAAHHRIEEGHVVGKIVLHVDL